MNSIEFTNKEQVFYNQYLGNFATPKKLNRSSKQIDPAIIERIESGELTSEDITELSLKVPVFTYKTCLTIHGNFPEITIQRIGGYKNIIQNKNGSLEVRYSAIDHPAKKAIKKFIGYGNKWTAKESSNTGIYFEKLLTADNKPEAIEILKSLSEEAKNFNIEGMKAAVSAAGYNVWGRFYLILRVSPLMVTGDPLMIAARLTGQSESNILARIEKEEQEQREEEAKQQQQRAEREVKKVEAAAALTGYKREQINPIPGNIYIMPVLLNNGQAGYRLFKVESKGSFGRFVLSSYVSTTPELNAENFKPYMNGKQLKAADIYSKETYLIN